MAPLLLPVPARLLPVMPPPPPPPPPAVPVPDLAAPPDLAMLHLAVPALPFAPSPTARDATRAPAPGMPASAAPAAPVGNAAGQGGLSPMAIIGGDPRAGLPRGLHRCRRGRVTVDCMILANGAPADCRIVSAAGGAAFANETLRWLNGPHHPRLSAGYPRRPGRGGGTSMGDFVRAARLRRRRQAGASNEAQMIGHQGAGDTRQSTKTDRRILVCLAPGPQDHREPRPPASPDPPTSSTHLIMPRP